MGSLLKVLKVLAEPTRLRLLFLLQEEELTVAELQEILGMGQSRISANLALLHREALVAQRRVGKNVFYSAINAKLEPLNILLREAINASVSELILRRVTQHRPPVLQDSVRPICSGQMIASAGF